MICIIKFLHLISVSLLHIIFFFIATHSSLSCQLFSGCDYFWYLLFIKKKNTQNVKGDAFIFQRVKTIKIRKINKMRVIIRFVIIFASLLDRRHLFFVLSCGTQFFSILSVRAKNKSSFNIDFNFEMNSSLKRY